MQTVYHRWERAAQGGLTSVWALWDVRGYLFGWRRFRFLVGRSDPLFFGASAYYSLDVTRMCS